jgi:hypothetical protein
MADDFRAHEPRRTPRIVRPYVLTQGRTKAPDATFALEAQVRSLIASTAMARTATPEARRIVDLCQSPLSVAEVAARLMLPLGVARVLVGDLVAANAVTVDVGAQDAANDVALLERLLDGIRAL